MPQSLSPTRRRSASAKSSASTKSSTTANPLKPPANSLFTVEFRFLATNFIRFVIALGLLAYILNLADLHKGYQVTPLSSPNDTCYQISVDVDRQHAKTYYNYMTANGLDTCAARDIRLPNSVLTVATVSLPEIIEFLQSDAQTTTITTIWSANDHTYAKTSESDNLITIYLPLHYNDIIAGIKAAEAEPNHQYLLRQDINLPSGRKGCCFLELDEMETYRRRMHTQGARWIILPFYFSISNTGPVNLPTTDRLA